MLFKYKCMSRNTAASESRSDWHKKTHARMRALSQAAMGEQIDMPKTLRARMRALNLEDTEQTQPMSNFE